MSGYLVPALMRDTAQLSTIQSIAVAPAVSSKVRSFMIHANKCWETTHTASDVRTIV